MKYVRILTTTTPQSRTPHTPTTPHSQALTSSRVVAAPHGMIGMSTTCSHPSNCSRPHVGMAPCVTCTWEFAKFLTKSNM